MNDDQRLMLRKRYTAGDTEQQAAVRAGVTAAEVCAYWAWWCDRMCEGES